MCERIDVIRVPKGETVWAEFLAKGKPRFVITSKQLRDWYFLYEVNGEELKKLGKARTPPELEERFKVHEKLKS